MPLRTAFAESFRRASSLSLPAIAMGLLTGLSSQVQAQTPLPREWSSSQFVVIQSIAYSPNGSKLAIGGSGGVEIMDVATGAFTVLHTHAQDTVNAVAWSPDGKTLAVGGSFSKGVVELWNPANNTLKGTLPTQEVNVSAIAFSPDGKSLTCGGWAGGPAEAEVWNVKTGALSDRLTAASSGTVSSVAYSKDGKIIVIGGTEATANGGFVELWNASSGTLKKSLVPSSYASAINSVAISPDGKSVAAGGTFADNNQVEFWNSSTGKPVGSLPTSAGGTISAICFFPSGKSLAVSGFLNGRSIAQEWNVSSGKLSHTFPSKNFASVVALTISPDGKSVVDGGESFLESWNAASGLETKILNLGPGVRGSVVAVSPDGKKIASGGSGSFVGNLQLTDASSKKTANLPTTANQGITAVTFSYDGSILATAGLRAPYSGGSTVLTSVLELWSVATGALITSLGPTPDSITALAFSRDGKTIAAGGSSANGAVIRQWDVSTKVQGADLFPAEADGVNALAFSNGNELADATQGSGGPLVHIWNQGQTLVGTYQGQDPSTASLTALQFSPQTETLVFGGNSLTPHGATIGTVNVLDSYGNIKLLPVDASLDGVISLAFTADGYGLIAAGQNNVQTFNLLDRTFLSAYQVIGLASFSSSANSNQCAYIEMNGTLSVAKTPYKAPLLIKSLIISPNSVIGGANVTGTVRLTAPAPVGGAQIVLKCLSAYIHAPATVTVPAGGTETSFTIKTSPTDGAFVIGVDISATLNGVSVWATVSFTAPPIVSFSLSKSDVKGGQSIVGTVVLLEPAGVPGMGVNVTLSSTCAYILQDVTVMPGQTSVTFSIDTSAVAKDTPVTITASCVNSKSITFTVKK